MGNGGAAIWARKRLEQLDHKVREGKANVTVLNSIKPSFKLF
jgi:hypothetical protein